MTSEPIKYYSIYPRWDVDWKSVDWRKVAQDEGLIKRDEDIAAANVAAIYAVQPAWPNTSKQPKPVEKPADPRAEGIAKAVANLNQNEYRLGASRWEP